MSFSEVKHFLAGPYLICEQTLYTIIRSLHLKAISTNSACSIAVVLKLFRLGTPQIILSEVGTPLYLFDSIPQRNIVNIADLKEYS